MSWIANSQPPPFHPGVQLLLQAYDYANELGRDVWDFAVEFPDLRQVGMNTNDLRWLVGKGLAEHAREVSQHCDAQRRFQKVGLLTASKRTCVVLTETGAEVLRDMLEHAKTSRDSAGETNGYHVLTDAQSSESVQKPTWDGDRQQLRWGSLIVKEFKLPSPNQEMILRVFEEENWPTRIDDPLPPHPNIEPKRRLNGTITSLNRNQKSYRIRFMGDGSGEGICWEPLSDALA